MVDPIPAWQSLHLDFGLGRELSCERIVRQLGGSRVGRLLHGLSIDVLDLACLLVSSSLMVLLLLEMSIVELSSVDLVITCRCVQGCVRVRLLRWVQRQRALLLRRIGG